MDEQTKQEIQAALKRWEDSRTYSTNIIDHYEAANMMRDLLQKLLEQD